MTTTVGASSAVNLKEITDLLAEMNYRLYQLYQLEEKQARSGVSVSADPPIGGADPTRLLGATGPEGVPGDAGATGSTGSDANGSHTILINAPHQIASSMHDDLFVVAADAFGQNTFVFTPNFGHDEITGSLGPRHHLGFQVGGPAHDTLALSGADFHNSIADVLRHTQNVIGGVQIFDPVTHDTIKIDGVSKFALAHNTHDFKFL